MTQVLRIKLSVVTKISFMHMIEKFFQVCIIEIENVTQFEFLLNLNVSLATIWEGDERA